MKIQCVQCGRCCRAKNYRVSVFEWEKDYLIQQAKDRKLDLEILPEVGIFSDNKMIVLYYALTWKNRCVFNNPDNSCMVYAKRPICCAMYPYPNLNDSWDTTWKCERERVENIKSKREMWYPDPKKSLPPGMAYATLLLRFFFEHNQIEFVGDGELFTSKKFQKGTVQMKPVFQELTRLGILPSMFLDEMKSYSFEKLSTIEEGLERLTEKIHPIIIDSNVYDRIFNHWNESAWEVL
jgi:Fe-S-cluster containining protein